MIYFCGHLGFYGVVGCSEWIMGISCYWLVFLFLTGLRLSHEAFHRNLGLPAVICDLLLLFLSPLMFTCLHATRYTHLQHHRFCLREGDIEGLAAKYSPFEVLYKGFQYPFLSHRFAWNSNDEFTKYWMRLELIWIILFYSIGFYFSHLFLEFTFCDDCCGRVC